MRIVRTFLNKIRQDHTRLCNLLALYIKEHVRLRAHFVDLIHLVLEHDLLVACDYLVCQEGTIEPRCLIEEEHLHYDVDAEYE